MTDDQSATADWLYSNGMRQLFLKQSKLPIASEIYGVPSQPHSLML
jgi:hypothetical protein